MSSFQVCYDGDLTLDVASAVRRLKGEPNFDKSWTVTVDGGRRSETVLRYLRRHIADEGQLIVARLNPVVQRECLLIRHSVTPNYDYTPLLAAIGSLGRVLELPLRGTYVVRADASGNASVLGEQLGELCPYDSLMVLGISSDFSVWSSADGMYAAAEDWLVRNEEIRL